MRVTRILVAGVTGLLMLSALMGLAAWHGGIYVRPNLYYGWDAAWRVGVGTFAGFVALMVIVAVVVAILKEGDRR